MGLGAWGGHVACTCCAHTERYRLETAAEAKRPVLDAVRTVRVPFEALRYRFFHFKQQ